MRFAILPQEGVMAIDNQTLAVDSSALGANVDITSFDSNDGVGSVEYNDRPKLLDRSSFDPTQYDGLINAWMTAATSLWDAMNPAEALQQAKKIKNGYVDALFNHKRQQPTDVDGRSWNGDDESVRSITNRIATWDAGSAVATAYNGMTITTGDANPATTVSSNLNNVTSTTSANHSPPMPAGQFWVTNPSAVSSYNPSASSAATGPIASSKTPIAVTGPSVPATPRGQTSPINLTMVEARRVVGSIAQRRQALNGDRLAKKNAVNSAGSIAAVIATPVATGWSS